MWSKSLKNVLAGLIIAGISSWLISCPDSFNPFGTTLGEKVDIAPPTIEDVKPTSGSYLKGRITFTGKAKAYRELRRVEVKIFNPEDKKEGVFLGKQEWTPITLIGDDIKEKDWTFDLDTSDTENYTYVDGNGDTQNGFADGFLYLQFRAFDPNLEAKTIEFVYIIKNGPSIIKMSEPSLLVTEDDSNNVPKVGTNTEIRVNVIDRRGIKPGYPQIKFWPEEMAEPADDDTNWGYAAMFLSGVDEYLDGNYANRNARRVETSGNFVLKLVNYTIDKETREIKYTPDPGNGDLIPLPTGKYRFRIKTYDSFFVEDTALSNYRHPREPEGDEVESIANLPEDVNSLAYLVRLVSTEELPEIEMDNTDLGLTDQELTDMEPHSYITPTSTKKILVSGGDITDETAQRVDFRLRILARHPDTIDRAVLRWEQQSRNGFLLWDDIGTWPAGQTGYVNNTSPATRAEQGHKGALKTNSETDGRIFRFTAMNGLKDANDNVIFTDSTEPYTLTVTVFSRSNISNTQTYTLYLGGKGPEITIRSIKGAYAEPEAPVDTRGDWVGGWVNNNPYTVNGNIQVSVDRSANMGIMEGKVKWVIEEAASADETGENLYAKTNSVYRKLRDFRGNPTAAGLTFFNDITETRSSGSVRLPDMGSTIDADRTHNFKFNTKEWDGKTLWLYIIAQDGVYNLGYTVQKLTVDEGTDKPEIGVSDFDESITSAKQLEVAVDANRAMTGNLTGGIRRNVLEGGQGIPLSFTDDDGINLTKSGVTITLKNETSGATATLTAAAIRALNAAMIAANRSPMVQDPNERNGLGRNWSGTLTQQMMAYAFDTAANKGDPATYPTRVPDGIYSIEIAVNDDEDSKVAIVPAVNPGDTPESASDGKKFFFVVYTIEPAITITTPGENSLQNSTPIRVEGTVSSRLNVQRLWITFDPNVMQTSNPAMELVLYSDPAYQNEVADPLSASTTSGEYLYYWKVDGVNFDPDNLFANESERIDARHFDLSAYDRMGYQGVAKGTVQVDRSPPKVELFEFNFGRPPENVNNADIFRVNGKVPALIIASDENGLNTNGELVGFKWWVLPHGSPAPVWETTLPGDAAGIGGQFKESDHQGGGRYKAVFDSRKLTEGGVYDLYAMAQDKAENYGSPTPLIMQTFTVYQAGDYPVFDETEMRPNATELRGSAGLFIAGRVTDDDGFNRDTDKAGQYVYIRFPRTVTPTLTWNNDDWMAIPGRVDPTGALLYNFLFSEHGGINAARFNGYFNTDGIKFYQITVYDEPDAGPNDRPPGKNPDGATSGQEGYIGAQPRLFPVSSDNSAYFTFTLDYGNPIVVFDHNDPTPNGENDNNHPNYTNFRPSFKTAEALAGALTGSIIEPHLESVYFYYGDSPTPHDLRPSLLNTGKWVVQQAWVDDFATAKSGMYSITIEAIDQAGNKARIPWSFYKDVQGPEIMTTNFARVITRPANPVNADFPANWPSDWPHGANWTTDGTWSTTWKARINTWPSAYAFMTPTEVIAALENDVKNGTVDRVPSVVSGDEVGLAIRGTFRDELSDILGKEVGSTATFYYRFNSTDGRNAAPDIHTGWTSAPTAPLAAGQRSNSAEWTVPIPVQTSFFDKEHTIDLKIADVSGNWSEVYGLRFIVDRNNPEIAAPLTYTVESGSHNGTLAPAQRVFSAAGSATAATAITLKGKVSDHNFASLIATIGSDGGTSNPYTIVASRDLSPGATTPVDQLNGANETPNTNRLTMTGPTQVGANGQQEYEWTLTILERDIAGLRAITGTNDTTRRYISLVATDQARRRSVTQTWDFYLDSKQPVIDFTTTVKAGMSGAMYSSFSSGSVDIKGNVEDGTGIQKIEFLISKWDYATNTWRWYNSTTNSWNVAITAEPFATGTWKTLFNGLSSQAVSYQGWTLDQARLTTAGYPADLFTSSANEGKYRIDLRVTDWSLPDGNPKSTWLETWDGVEPPTNPPSNNMGRIFFIDDTDPLITWPDDVGLKEPKRYFKNEADNTVPFNFTVKDSNTITKVEWEILEGANSLPGFGRSTTGVTYVTGDNPYSTDTRSGTLLPELAVGGVPLDMEGGSPYPKSPRSLTIRIYATDGAGRMSSITKQFVLDNVAPVLQNITPGTADSTNAVTGRLSIKGNTTDNSNLFKRVAYYVAHSGNSFAAPANALTGTAADKTNGWFYDDAVPANTNNAIMNGNVRLMEIGSGTFTWQINVPNTRNLYNMWNPSESQTQTQYVQWGTKNAPNSGANWAVQAANVRYGGQNIPVDDHLGRMTVYFMAMDEAGNTHDFAPGGVTYWIYPEGDRPEAVDIRNPDMNSIATDNLMNGTIRISGRARDNEQVKYVWFRILGEQTGGGAQQPFMNLEVPNWNTNDWSAASGNQTPKTLADIGGSLHSTDPFSANPANSGGWYMANNGTSGNSVGWYVEVNTRGELSTGAGGFTGSRNITVQVRVEDGAFNDDGTVDYATPGMISRNALVATIPVGGTYDSAGVKPAQAVALIVTEAPIFENTTESISQGAVSSGVINVPSAADPYTGYTTINTTSISKQGSYRITVKNINRLGSIRWTPTRRDGNNFVQASGDMVNILNLPGDVHTQDRLTATTGIGHGMRVWAQPHPQFVRTGTVTLQSGTYTILNSGAVPALPAAVTSATGFAAIEEEEVSGVRRPRTFRMTANVNNVALGSTQLLQKNVDYFEYIVTVDINTATIESAGYANGAVRYPLYLQAVEISGPNAMVTRRTSWLPVDNVPPSAQYTINRRPAGSNAMIGGEAGDTGDVSGVGKVVMWLSRRGGTAPNYTYTNISWRENGGGVYTNGQQITTLNSLNTSVNITLPQIGTGNNPSTDSGIVIDKTDATGTNGRKMSFGMGGMGRIWWVEFDSTLITSGPIYLNYVVYDQAGNTRYYREQLVIMNNAPMIGSINLATDIRADNGQNSTTNLQTTLGGNVTTNVSMATNNTTLDTAAAGSYLRTIRGNNNTNDKVSRGITEDIPVVTSSNTYAAGTGVIRAVMDFRVRNNLLAFRVNALAAPNAGKTRNFRFEYVSSARQVTGVATTTDANNVLANTIKAGAVYIIETRGDANWGAVGAPEGNWARGFTFLATSDGRDENGIARISGTGSAWEINGTYYTQSGGVWTRVAANIPQNLRLADVGYTTAQTANARSAEFVYKQAAFGSGTTTTGGVTVRTGIADTSVAANVTYPPATGDPSANHALFIAKIFDGDELDQFADYALLAIRVNNNDRTIPSSQLYDLNPLTEGQERAQTQQRSLAPMSIGDNRLRGGLWNTDERAATIAKSGHIEPRRTTSLTNTQMGGAASAGEATISHPQAGTPASTFFATDTVSGRVILRGFAEDDQRINRIDLVFNNTAPSTGFQTVTILSKPANNSAASAGTPATFIPATTGLLAVPTGTNTTNRVYYTDDLNLYRHRVEWAYIWDTEAIPNTIVAGAANVRAIVYNDNSATIETINNIGYTIANKSSVDTNAPTTGTAGTLNNYNRIAVNIRPYITGFMRNQNAGSLNTRSRQGRYMFARGEVAVVTGFNLLSGNTNTNIILPGTGTNRVSITTANVGTIGNYGITAANNVRYRQFTIPETQSGTTGAVASGTGLVTLTVNGYSAVNTPTPVATATNETAASIRPMVSNRPVIQPWNVEYDPGKEGSELWDDYTTVHIWQSNDTTTASTDQGRFKRASDMTRIIETPSMTIDPASGTLWASHNEGGGGGGNTGTTKVSNNWDNPTFSGNITTGTGNTVYDSSYDNPAMRTASFLDPVVDSDIHISTRPSGYDGSNFNYTVWSTYSIIGRGGSSGQPSLFRNMGGVFVTGPQGSELAGTQYDYLYQQNSGVSAGNNQDRTGLLRSNTNNDNYAVSARNGFRSTAHHSAQSQYIAESTAYNGTYDNVNPPRMSNSTISYRADPLSLNQFRNPHIVTAYSGGNEHIHVAYYDTLTQSIKYRYNRRGEPGVVYGNGTGPNGNQPNNYMTAANNPVYGWTNLDGGWDPEDTFELTNTTPFTTVATNARIVGYNNPNGNGFSGYRNMSIPTGLTTPTTTVSGSRNVIANNNNTGEHNAIAVDRNGYPVIAYYDATQQRLKLAVSRSTAPYAATNWTIRDYVIPSGNTLSTGTGQYVSLRIDTSGNNNIVHIAALNANSKQVVYIRGTLNPTSGTTGTYGLYQSTGGVLTDVVVQVVDSVGSVGKWTKISLDNNGNPWIAYQDEGRVGARDGVKVAFLNTTAFTKGATGTAFAGQDLDLYGNNITGWEAMHVPTQFRVRNTRLGMENFPTRNVTASATKFWKGAVGYLSDDYFRIAYYVE